jgi:hypothetical protein
LRLYFSGTRGAPAAAAIDPWHRHLSTLLLSLQRGLIVLWRDLPHTLSHARNKSAASWHGHQPGILSFSKTWLNACFRWRESGSHEQCAPGKGNQL